jgi:hypothetical protein
MTIEFNLITGIMAGIEYSDFTDEGGEKHLVIDILFFRVLFSWE